MCFSAEASFGAGIVLTTIGVVTLKKAKNPNEMFFASIPFIFAAQQITEGLLWLSLKGKIDIGFETPTTYIFLIIAQILWPFWVPFSIYKVESSEKRKPFLKILIAIGIFVSLYNIYCLMFFNFKANIIGHHIAYLKEYPFNLRYLIGACYVFVTIFPPIFSTVKHMRTLSLVVLTSSLVTGVFYKEYFVSVWCFFASVISITVFIVMNRMSKTHSIANAKARAQ